MQFSLFYDFIVHRMRHNNRELRPNHYHTCSCGKVFLSRTKLKNHNESDSCQTILQSPAILTPKDFGVSDYQIIRLPKLSIVQSTKSILIGPPDLKYTLKLIRRYQKVKTNLDYSHGLIDPSKDVTWKKYHCLSTIPANRQTQMDPDTQYNSIVKKSMDSGLRPDAIILKTINLFQSMTRSKRQKKVRHRSAIKPRIK